MQHKNMFTECPARPPDRAPFKCQTRRGNAKLQAQSPRARQVSDVAPVDVVVAGPEGHHGVVWRAIDLDRGGPVARGLLLPRVDAAEGVGTWYHYSGCRGHGRVMGESWTSHGRVMGESWAKSWCRHVAPLQRVPRCATAKWQQHHARMSTPWLHPGGRQPWQARRTAKVRTSG